MQHVDIVNRAADEQDKRGENGRVSAGGRLLEKILWLPVENRFLNCQKHLLAVGLGWRLAAVAPAHDWMVGLVGGVDIGDEGCQILNYRRWKTCLVSSLIIILAYWRIS